MATIEATMPAELQAQLDRLQAVGTRLAPQVLEFGTAHRRFKQAVMAWQESVPDPREDVLELADEDRARGGCFMTVAERCECPHTGHTVECVRAWVAASRAAQGLPPTLTDPATLARIARMIRDTPTSTEPSG